MRHTGKTIVSVFLALLTALSVLTAALPASAAESGAVVGGVDGVSGDCSWSYSLDVLTISGAGATDDYDYDNGSYTPWSFTVTEAVIEDGVTRIGNDAFAHFPDLKSVTIPASVTSIGSGVFNDCGSLTDIYYGAEFADWEKIDIGDNNLSLYNTVIHCKKPPQPYVSVTLDKSSLSLTAGKSAALTVKVVVKNTTVDSVTWKSSDPNVAVVSNKGVITAKSAGTATVTATAGGVSASCKVTVTPAVAKIAVSYSALTLEVGKKASLDAAVSPADASAKITWTSSDPKIVSVDNNGRVTAKAPGKAVIYCGTDGGSKAGCKVTVNYPVTKVKLNKTKATLCIKCKLSLKATLTPLTGINKSLKWTTSDKKVATVDQKGNVVAKAAGKATVTVTAVSGKKASCVITVCPVPSKVKLNKKAVTLKKGKTYTLKASLTPKNAKTTYKWSSSNKKIATVDKNGKVKAVKKGKATVTVKTANGKKATCKITVK